MTYRLGLVMAWVLAAAPGCVTASEGMQSQFRETAWVYNRSLRWGDTDRAAEYLPMPSQGAFLETHEDTAEELVIVDYELTRLDLDPGTGVARSRAEITWHTDRELIVKTTEVEQVWQFFEGNFFLVEEHREGGTPLTIFAEKEETPHPYLPGL